VLRIFYSRIWLIAVMSALCVGAAAVYIIKTPKKYAATAVLEAKSPTQSLNVVSREMTNEVNALEEQHTFEQSLTNRTLLISVVRDLHLDHDSRLFPKRAADREVSDAEIAKAITPLVQAELRRGTRLVDLKVTYFDPETAKQIADKVIELYIAQGMSMETGASAKATTSLAMEAERLRQKLAESDKALQAFKEKNSGLPQDAGFNLSVERTKELNAQFSKAKGERLQLEADMAALDQNKNGPAENLLSIGSIASQPDVMELNRVISDKQREFLVLKEWSGPRHPRYAQAQKEIDYLTTSRNDTLKNAASKLRANYETALEAEKKLQAAIVEQEHISTEAGKQIIPLAQLQNEVNTNRELYEMVAKRVKETNLAATLAVANFRVTEAPIVQPEAVWPRKTQLLGIALVAGLMLGAGAAFGLEVLNPSDSRPRAEAPTPPDLPILAELPATGQDSLTLAIDCALHRHTPECAAFRTLRSSISFLRHDQESRSITVTSATEDGETSFCALNLAATYAGEQLRTLLIVADFKNHDLDGILIDPARGPVRGLYEGLANSLQPEGFCHATPIPNLYFIPAGIPVTDPVALLKGENFRELMIRAWNVVDRIIVCAPPLAEMKEPVALLQYAEAVCLVAKSGRTSRSQIASAASRLRFPGHGPAGLVLTSAPPRIMAGQPPPDTRSLLHAAAETAGAPE
jgi:uncharacterized protein involved in exopolysaccharide biosynthesis/Mrp family chromosome partitioning ATPase